MVYACVCTRACCISGDFIFVFLHPSSSRIASILVSRVSELFHSQYSMDRKGSHNQPSRSSGRTRTRSSSSVNSRPEGPLLRIAVAKNLIERCMQLYMTKNEVINTLFAIVKIDRSFTELVWQQLERDNAVFFKAYYTRLILRDQILAFNNLLRRQELLTEHLSRQPVQRSPPGLTTGNPAIQNPPIPFPSADHGNVSTEQMNSGIGRGSNYERIVRNANVASQFLHLQSDMSRGFDSASKSQFQRIPQSLSFGLDDEPKSSTGVVMSDPNDIWSNLLDLPTGIPAIQQPPILFPSAAHGNFLSMQMNSGNELVWNENGASSNSQFLQLTSDMSSGFDTASKPDFERIPQSLRFGMDGEPKSSTGVLMSHPTSWFGSDCSSLPDNLGNPENKRRNKDE